ncbi:MAG TPA: hypothetical protein VGO28_00105 [Acidimicrobiia bacterium]
MKRVAAAAVIGVLAVPLLIATTSDAAAADTPKPKARRLLVISLPAVTWQDIQDRVHELPNLTRLLDESAIGGLTTRTIDRHTTLADGYVTLGAGARAVGTETETDGEGFEVAEPFAGTTAGQVFERRTGRTARGGLVNLGLGGIIDKNDQQLFDAEIGALGDTLASADWSRAVIANGDGEDTEQPLGGYYRRQAVSGLMGSNGEVPAGAVGPELLVPDAQAPFGLRYDNNAVLNAFRDVWKPHTVALVEGSDLVREDAYRPLATSSQRARLLGEALRRTDALVGGLLREVDPRQDAVMVVGPVHPARKVQLSVAALRAPGVQPGLLRTGTTRRPGFVQIVDIAPTILDRVGLTAPDSMEGRPFEIRDEGGSASQRRAGIVDANAAATFRDEIVSVVAIVFVVIQVALVIGALVWLARPGLRRLGTVLHFAGLAALGFIVALLLAQLVPFHDYGQVAYWGALAAASLGLAAISRLAGRGDRLMSLVVALGMIVAVLIVDVLFGAPLQLSNPLGYSPLLAARFSGYGNIAYSALSAAAVLLAGLLAHRIGGRRGVWTASAVLAVVFVVDGAPMWGSDVGGVLSILPAYAATAYLLLGYRIRLRTVLIGAVATVVALVAFGAFDLTRPSDKRTHLGRLLETLQTRGWSGVSTVIQRKIYANLSVLLGSTWLLVVLAVLAFLAYTYSRRRDRLQAIVDWVPELRASYVGFAILATLGFALNDSGIAIPGMMLSVLMPVIVVLLVLAHRRVPPGEPAPPEVEPAPAMVTRP